MIIVFLLVKLFDYDMLLCIKIYMLFDFIVCFVEFIEVFCKLLLVQIGMFMYIFDLLVVFNVMCYVDWLFEFMVENSK